MIDVYWDDGEETIIRLDYFEPVANWAEYEAANQKAYTMAISKNYDVIILHNANQTRMPRQGNAFLHLRKVARLLPVNVCIVIMYISNPFARQITASAARLIHARGSRFPFVASLDEAYKLIERHKEKNSE